MENAQLIPQESQTVVENRMITPWGTGNETLSDEETAIRVFVVRKVLEESTSAQVTEEQHIVFQEAMVLRMSASHLTSLAVRSDRDDLYDRAGICRQASNRIAVELDASLPGLDSRQTMIRAHDIASQRSLAYQFYAKRTDSADLIDLDAGKPEVDLSILDIVSG